MAGIRIELFGNLRITHGQIPITSVNTNRVQSLLAFLVLHGEAQPRERLAYLLWPESSESQARTNLRQLLHHLRRALPAECSLLAANNQTVQWRRDGDCAIDVLEFEAAVTRAAEAEKRGALPAAREALEEAARLHQDDLLPGLYDEWLQPRREQLRAQLAQVLSSLAALSETLGDYPAGIRYAERLVGLDPLREPYYQSLMRLHARNRDRSSALRVYHQCMQALKRELGISPGKVTQDLFTQVLKSEALSSVPVETPPDAAALPTPMVGRKKEWERLLTCWRRAMGGETRLALIQGEPGIGKSRLAEELFQRCRQDGDGAVARARCYFAQGQLAYAPVAEWLRSEPLRSARAQLSKTQLAELARVLPEILVEHPEIAPPQPLSESWQRRHFYEALHAALGKTRKPLLLLIDDLQWCDRDSIEWLDSLFRSEPAGRILALATVRPEETGRDHPLTGWLRDLRQSGQVEEIAMAPLEEEETAALAAQVGKREFDAAFLRDLYRATKGNPLFVVESVRAGHQDGAFSPRVHAVISARLAQLSAPAYELAGLAATIGGSFSVDLLAKATDWDEESLSRALEELWQRRIIDGRGAGDYDYTHDLLREVAFAELSPVRRRFLHRRVARALEEFHAADIDSVSGRLAAHYEAAGSAEQAIRHYQRSATVARGRYADAEAAASIRRALALCLDFPETAARDGRELDLLVALGPSLIVTRGYGVSEVGETYARAVELSERLDEKKHLLSVLSGAWLFHLVRGGVARSRELGEQCLELAEGSMAGHFLLGSSLFHLGRFEDSVGQLEQALADHSGPSHSALALFVGPDVSVFCRSYLSHALWHLGRAGEAAARSEEAIALARRTSHPFSLAIALDYAAMLHVFRRQSGEALNRAQEAAAVCRKHGFVYYLAWAEILTGWAKAVEGDRPAGLAQLRKGLEALKATGAELRLPFYYGLLAQVCGLAGQDGEALANVASGFAFQSKNGEMWAAAALHRIHGELLLKSRTAEAER